MRVIAAEFVYSIKTRRRFHSHAKCTYRVLARFPSLLFAMRTSTVATAYKKVTMITSTHFLTLSSLRWKGLLFLLPIYRIHKLNCDFFNWQFFTEKQRNIDLIPSVLERGQRWPISWKTSIKNNKNNTHLNWLTVPTCIYQEHGTHLLWKEL